MRNTLSNLLRHSIRTTFRVLKQQWSTWKDMPDAQKILWRESVEKFYLSRETVDDLDWTTVSDRDDTFSDGPLKGLSLAVFRLDFSRVTRLRVNAARIRCGWTPEQQAKWKHERTEAETTDDCAFGFDSTDPHRFDDWPPLEQGWETTGLDTIMEINSDSDEVQEGDARSVSAASGWTQSSQGTWWSRAADSAGAAWSWHSWHGTATTAPPSERWNDGQPQSDPGDWSDYGRWPDPVTPPPGLEREQDLVRYLDLLTDEHLGLPPARSESLRGREVRPTDKYQPLFKQGRFAWDHLANKAEPHVRRTFGKNPVESAKGSTKEPWQKWSWELTQMVPAKVTSCETAQDEVLSWLSMRPSLWDSFDSMHVRYNLEPFGMNMYGLPGLWLQFTMKDAPQPHVHVLDATRRFGYHGTSMYCIASIFRQGHLSTGMASLIIEGKPLQGVYYHEAKRAHLCQGTYMHYIGFGGGWYVAPLIVLDSMIQCVDSDGYLLKSVARRATEAQKQHITYPNQHRLCGMFLHFVHASQVRKMPKSCWICAEPGWVPDLELCPTETWEKFQERSRSLACVPPGI